jgi:hypothetical protein
MTDVYRGGKNLFLVDHNVLFVHIPKTGGCWVRYALDKVDVKYRHARPKKGYGYHFPPHQCADEFEAMFTFVRHPLSWYESWWKYQVGAWKQFAPGLWHPQRCLDELQDDDFNSWVTRVMNVQPAYVTRMYEWFLGPPLQDCVSRRIEVGRTETIQDDLRKILRDLGIVDVDPRKLDLPRVNVSAGPQPEWHASVRDRAWRLERAAIARFYPEELA